MTVSEPILAGLMGAAAVALVALISAWGHINSRLGKVEKGQEGLAAEILASRERSDMQHAAAMERLAAAEERALAREAAAEERALARHNTAMSEIRAVDERSTARHDTAMSAIWALEERALARHNELLSESRLWRTHGHDADGNIFFRVPE